MRYIKKFMTLSINIKYEYIMQRYFESVLLINHRRANCQDIIFKQGY